MNPLWLASVLAIAFGLTSFCGEQPEVAPKTVVVTPGKTAAVSANQQLLLRGLKAPGDTVGVQVFLNPAKTGKLTAKSPSYVGSVYFSHRRPSDKEGQDFAITLHEPVTGPARLVLNPISSKNAYMKGRIDLQEAAIQPADNSAYR